MDSAIVRAKAITREVALKKVEKKEKPDRVKISIILSNIKFFYRPSKRGGYDRHVYEI